MQNKTTKFFSFLLIGVLLSTVVFAVETEPSITPASNIYGLKIAWEKITEIFNPALKIEHAQERIRELAVVTRKGDATSAQKLIEKIRENQKQNLIKSEEVDKAQREYSSKFNIDYTKLKEAINSNDKYTKALTRYQGIVALFVKYPGTNDKVIKLSIDEAGRVTEILEVEKIDNYNFYFNLSHGQLYAYSRQLISGESNNLIAMLNALNMKVK